MTSLPKTTHDRTSDFVDQDAWTVLDGATLRVVITLRRLRSSLGSVMIGEASCNVVFKDLTSADRS